MPWPSLGGCLYDGGTWDAILVHLLQGTGGIKRVLACGRPPRQRYESSHGGGRSVPSSAGGLRVGRARGCYPRHVA